MGKNELNARQRQILEFIRGFDEEWSYPPTIRDIQQACSISSTSVVDYNLRILVRDGYIRRDPEVSRGIEVLGENKDKNSSIVRKLTPSSDVRVSVLGYIAAGEPVPVPTQESWGADEPIDVLDLPQGFLGKIKSEVYGLKVRGTSMIDALVDDGDVIVVEPVDSVQDGEMVVAWLVLEKEATLKRIYRDGDRIRLQPANSTMSPIYVDPENIEVQGRVVAVIRTRNPNMHYIG